jgi:hypothetical protein
MSSGASLGQVIFGEVISNRDGISGASWGTVTATSPLTVRPRGSATSMPAYHLASIYTPTVNDQVAYIPFDRRSALILGKPS